ncbi:glycosyltransferase family 4 protein [Candidatus Woesebacteria bacterium]|nr:glycosyltransferase family 4 protein [Candidatus Woesebacteria bacterium]
MKIAIDLSQVVYGTGVSHYQENLVRALLKVDKENQYLLYGGSLRRKEELRSLIGSLSQSLASTKVFPVSPMMGDFIWNKLHILPIEWLIGKVDVLHSSDWTQPPSKAFKVTTIHDLAPLKFSRYTDPKIVSAHKARLNRVAKEVDRVIVPSIATKADLLELGFDEAIIRVIPEAPNQSLVSRKEVEKVKRKHKIFGKYLLSVGVNPRKNTERIIDAFHLAKSGESLKLVLVGHPNFIKIEEQRDIRILGHLESQEVSALYSGAEALLYPSLYEGFGAPILDAFNCHCPVLTSNLSSMPEVAGNAAILVDPYSLDSIVEGIKKTLSSRKTLIKKGLAQVKKFSWEKTARETLGIYREAK